MVCGIASQRTVMLPDIQLEPFLQLFVLVL